MRINSLAGTQIASLVQDDSGEGLSIFFSQGGDSVVRYRFRVKARIDEGIFDMGEFFSSPPGATSPIPGRLSRMVAGAVCPGAVAWSVEITPVGVDGEQPASETAEITLASSKCCTAPIGVTRVSERYAYASADNEGISTNFIVLPGMTVTGIAAFGYTGGGTVVISSGDIVLVPAGISINFEPKGPIQPNTAIELNNVDWVIEYLESA